MTMLKAGQPFPKQKVAKLGGGELTLGEPREGRDWQLVVLYRGLHCPICKKYLKTLEGLQQNFYDIGVDVVAVSGDPEEKAREMADEQELSLAVGYGLTLEQMAALGAYISDPRSPQETDRPFAEPATYVINAQGNVQIVDVSNAPFSRPDLEGLLGGLKFIRENDYPVRGTRKAA
ncbi:redoxin domain-containing protein [Sulfitobacter aestuarii]|uniref:Redoxin domain-containing protein n=1 Tax=Sulfitobacter aestuarii TaxID=2161676 RepID=A0ABW5TZU3_9RHOB